eukprot:3233687-Pyramimonas_sp.AAC.1
MSSAAEKEAARKKQRIEANLNMSTGGTLGRKAFNAVQPKITTFGSNAHRCSLYIHIHPSP